MPHNNAENLGWVPKSENLQATIEHAFNYARQNSHVEVTLEHLLLALLDDTNASVVFSSCQIDTHKLRNELSGHIQTKLIELKSLSESPSNIEVSEGLQKVMAHASAAAEQSQRTHIDGAIVLAALIGEGESYAANILDAHGLTFEVAVSNLKNNAPTSNNETRVTPQQQDDFNQTDTSSSLQDEIAASLGADDKKNIPNNQNHDSTSNPQWPHYSDNISPGMQDAYNVPNEYNDLDSSKLPGGMQQSAEQTQNPKEQNGGISSDSTVEDILASVREIIGVEEEISVPDQDRVEKPEPVRRSLPEQEPFLEHSEPQETVKELKTPVNNNSNQNSENTDVAFSGNKAPNFEQNRPLEQHPQQQPRRDTPYNRPQDFVPPLGHDMKPADNNRNLPPPAPNQGGYQTPPQNQTWQEQLEKTGMQQNAGMPREMPKGNMNQGHINQANMNQGHMNQGNMNSAPGQRNMPPPIRRMGPPQGADPRANKKRMALPEISQGQLIENIPRMMRVSVPVDVEVRVAKNEVQNIEKGLVGNNPNVRHEVLITEAMTLQLVAPNGGFTIENRSPETQWIDNRLGIHGENYGSWKWTITPTQSGKKPINLVISARIVGERGVVAQSSLPEQLVTIEVKVNYAQLFKRVAGWAALAAIGGAIGKYSETIVSSLSKLY